ncbi:MAG TPA: DUF898 family protein, partial [bacterium]|nr:DUF898 family protein [bacterium]
MVARKAPAKKKKAAKAAKAKPSAKRAAKPRKAAKAVAPAKPVEAAAQPEEGAVSPFSYLGDAGTLFGIQVVNLFLTICTLGIYHFWGKTRLRKYLWGQLEFEGDRFSYHGTAQEILRGWVKAALVFGVPYFAFRDA